ncbi:TetR/AcrR family transcriptional regulator [Mycolicibacterium vaccae]|uniref:TetR/AcrR family transcriptional regulator n=1 Tax=Mycolicibacterium vaccae TaxID=1810 RepID=UPI003D053F69
MTAPQRADPVGERIHQAALDLLRARGPRAVTMQAITDATGIAKTTLYRRHPHRRALLAAALEQLALDPSMPANADPTERARWAVTHSIEVLTHGIGVGGFAALLTDEDPDFSDAFRAILAARRAHMIEVLGCDEVEGQTLIDMIVGSYVAELARTATIDDSWSERLTAAVERLLTR